MIPEWLRGRSAKAHAVYEHMSDAVRLSGRALPQMRAANSADGRRMPVDLIGWLCMIPAAMQHGGHMTHEQTADLLKRAAVRLSQSFFTERENELDSRWDGDIERAETFRNEAEEVRSLIEECRAAAALMTDAGTRPPRSVTSGHRAGATTLWSASRPTSTRPDEAP